MIYVYMHVRYKSWPPGLWLGAHPKGGSDSDDMVAKLAKIGASGQHPQNCERDLQTAIRVYGQSIGVPIETCRVRLWDPHENEIYYTNLPATWQVFGNRFCHG